MLSSVSLPAASPVYFFCQTLHRQEKLKNKRNYPRDDFCASVGILDRDTLTINLVPSGLVFRLEEYHSEVCYFAAFFGYCWSYFWNNGK